MAVVIAVSVSVEGRGDGRYLFEDERDAARFAGAVERAGGRFASEVEPVIPSGSSTVFELIAAELADVQDLTPRERCAFGLRGLGWHNLADDVADGLDLEGAMLRTAESRLATGVVRHWQTVERLRLEKTAS